MNWVVTPEATSYVEGSGLGPSGKNPSAARLITSLIVEELDASRIGLAALWTALNRLVVGLLVEFPVTVFKTTETAFTAWPHELSF